MLKHLSIFIFSILLAACGGESSDTMGQADNFASQNAQANDSILSAKAYRRSSRPSAVASMTLSSPTSSSMVVTWTAPTNIGSSPITGYQVGWIEGGTGRTWASPAPYYPLSASPLTLTNLNANTSYQVQVTPYNSSGAGITTSRTLSTTAAVQTPPGTTLTTPVVGGYYPNWTASPIRIRDVNSNYNLIYLFSAEPVGGSPGTTGAVKFYLPGDGRGAATNFVADLKYARSVQGRKIILSVGGAGNSMTFPTREKSQTFVNSVVAIYNQLGGFDGLDWNTYEGITPDTSEMIWMSQELKRIFPGFLITTPPAPWRAIDQTFSQSMAQAGVLDYAAPQYYAGPGLDSPAYVADNINKWVTLLGVERVVIGFGISNAVNYMTVHEAVDSWTRVKSVYPSIRGAFNWEIHSDEASGWAFANTLGPLIQPTPASTTPPASTPWRPALADTWQWQLSGTIKTPYYPVTVYDIDLFDTSIATIQALQAAGKKVICYFSAGSSENWRSDFSKFQAADMGKNLDGWAGERWLDTRSANVRQIMRARLDLAVSKGCNGVEPDNVDGYTNSSGFPLTAATQLDYNRFLAREAHQRGVAIALKNDVDQVADLVGDFDFALNEECHQYNECDGYQVFINSGKPVFNAEYASTYTSNATVRQTLCNDARARKFHTLVLPLNLDDRFRYSCEP